MVPLQEFFEARVRLGPGDCWTWTGSRNRKYGTCRKQLAHRVSYRLHIDKIPSGMMVCHSCDNPSCVNPTHLFLGDHIDNMNDMLRKGRGGFSSKLTQEIADSIRGEKRADGSLTLKDLSARHGVSAQQINYILKGLAWTGVPKQLIDRGELAAAKNGTHQQWMREHPTQKAAVLSRFAAARLRGP